MPIFLIIYGIFLIVFPTALVIMDGLVGRYLSNRLREREEIRQLQHRARVQQLERELRMRP